MATLKQIIAALPIGKAQAMKVPAFEKAIGNHPTGTNNDQTRREVKEAIVNHTIPIGSNPHKGYWLIDSDDECQEVVDRLDATITDLTAKRDAIKAGWRKRKASKNTGKLWPK